MAHNISATSDQRPAFQCPIAPAPWLTAGCKAKLGHLLLLMIRRVCPRRVMIVGRWPPDRLGQCTVNSCKWPWLAWCHAPNNCQPHLTNRRKQVWGQHMMHEGVSCDRGRLPSQPVPRQACLCRSPGSHMPVQPNHLQQMLEPLMLRKQHPQRWSSVPGCHQDLPWPEARTQTLHQIQCCQ